MKILCSLVCLLAAIGAINWGLVAFLHFNLVEYIEVMAGNKGVDVILYGIIAAAGVLSFLKSLCKLFKSCGCKCNTNCACNPSPK